MKAKDLRSSILQLAISGKLVPQNPDDEPASVLLAKIRAEKAKLVKEGKIKKQKPLPPVTEDEKPFDIPDSWVWVRLGEIVTIQSSKRVFEQDYVSSGIPFFRSKEIGDLCRGDDIHTQLYISNKLYENIKKNHGVPSAGDILLTSVGTIGNAWIVDNRKFYYKDGNITQICKNDCFLSQYMLLYIHSSLFAQQADTTVAGTAYNALTIIKLSNLLFPLPPINEQKCITTKIAELEPLEDKYDKLETELAALNETFPQDLRKSLLQYAIEGKLVPQDPNDEPASVLLEKIRAEKAKLVKEGKIKPQKPLPPITEDEKPFDIPDNWVWVRLGEIMNVRGGKRIPLGHNFSAKPTNHIYIRVTDMKNGYITDNNLKYIDDEVFNLIKQYTISKNDLYITIAGTIGEVGEVPPKFDGMNLTENAAKLSILMCNHNFLKLTLLSDLIQTQFIDKTNQVAQPKLALKRIESTLFPLPPLAEQKRIVAKLEQLLPYCGDKLFSFAADK